MGLRVRNLPHCGGNKICGVKKMKRKELLDLLSEEDFKARSRLEHTENKRARRIWLRRSRISRALFSLINRYVPEIEEQPKVWHVIAYTSVTGKRFWKVRPSTWENYVVSIITKGDDGLWFPSKEDAEKEKGKRQYFDDMFEVSDE